MQALGSLRLPFIAAALALVALAFAFTPHPLGNYALGSWIIQGTLTGAALVAVLYAVMRALAGRHPGATGRR
jgi:hypothetical protein